MKPSVAMLLFGHYPSDGRVRREAEILVKKGYDVDVVALCDDPAIPSYTLQGVQVYQVRLKQKRGGIIRYCFEYGAFCAMAGWLLGRLRPKRRYKVVHVNNMPNFLVFGALIPKLHGAKIVLDVHDPFPELFALKIGGWKGKIAGKLIGWEERASVAFSDRVIASTELIREAMIGRGAPPWKVSVILNSPDTQLFNPALYKDVSAAKKPEKRFTLLYAGTVTERVGLASMVKALALARPRAPTLILRIIGGGDYLDALRSLVKDLGLQDAVEFEPKMPIDRIPREYAAADAVVWCAERNPFIDIVMCVKLLEAVAMGLPVVATRTRCHEYYFRDGEVAFIKSLDVSSLADIMVDLCENREKRTLAPEEVERFISKFTWAIEGERYGDLIAELARPLARELRENAPARSGEAGEELG